MLNREGRAYQSHSVRNLLRLSICHGRRGDKAARSDSISPRPNRPSDPLLLSYAESGGKDYKETLEDKTKAIEAASNEDAAATSRNDRSLTRK